MSSIYQRQGALSLPITTADLGDSGASILDPARDAILELLATAITSELGPTFDVLKASTELSARSIVQDKLPFAPDVEILQQQKTGFPLLCLARDGEGISDEHTLAYERITQKWALDYILGPLNLADARKLNDLLIAVVKVCKMTIRKGRHPDHENGTDLTGRWQYGDAQSGEGGAKLSSIRMTTEVVGKARIAQGADAPAYWAASMTLETVETDASVDGWSGENTITGATLTMGLAGEGDTIAEFVEGEAEHVIQSPMGVPSPLHTGDTNPTTAPEDEDLPFLTNSALYDAFNRLRVSSPCTILDAKQVYDNAPLVYVQDLSGSGSAVYTAALAATRLSSGSTTATHRATRQTKRYFNYKPGKSQLIAMTFTAIAGIQAGAEKRVGLFDDDNGIFFKAGPTVNSFVVRNATSDTVVNQADWSLDTLDGAGASGITLDISQSQILIMDLQWLGVGNIRVGFEIGGEIIYVHEFAHSNSSTAVYMQTPNLPLRWEVENTGTPAVAAVLDQICCSIISEGGQEPVGIERVATSARNTAISVGSNLEPIVSIRLNSSHLRATVIPKLANLISTSNGDVRWLLQLNPTVTGTAGTWSTPTSSAIEVNTTRGGAVVSEDGICVGGGFFSNNQDSVSAVLSSVLVLASDYSGTPDELVLAAQTASGGGTEAMLGAISWLELT